MLDPVLTLSYLIPTTIESGPTRCSTRVSLKPISFINPAVGAGVMKPPGFYQHVETHEKPEGVLQRSSSMIDS